MSPSVPSSRPPSSRPRASRPTVSRPPASRPTAGSAARPDAGERASASPATPSRSTLSGHGLALALRAALWGLRVLPLPIADLLCDIAALPLVTFARMHERRVASRGRGLFRNQCIVYRERWTPRLGRRLLFAWARHMTRLAVDLARLPRLRPSNVRRIVNLDQLDKVRPHLAAGRGAICVTGHLGVWELAGYAPNLCGIGVTSAARPTGLEPVDRVVRRLREGSGQRVLPKWGVLWALRRALAEGRAVGLVADENSPDDPVFAPFLGTAAATSRVPATLHLRLGVPLLVATVNRTGRRRPRYRLHVWDVLPARSPGRADEAEVEAITARVNDALSRALLRYPEQWFWGSRRYFTRPPGERPGDDGLPPRATTGVAPWRLSGAEVAAR